ncbi:hypothetical protein EI94DRAFT_1760667 [Lactarius quietus]|nr:hypothetical protein EI94DRAFT_1760667 [Lactarius quietus]
MDGLRFVFEAQLSQTDRLPRFVISCDKCHPQTVKCVQIKSQPLCETCDARNMSCPFPDGGRYSAEQSHIVTGASAGPSPTPQRTERSSVSPTRGGSDHSGVTGSFRTNTANLLPVLPSTSRGSRYQGAVCVCVSPTTDPLGTNLVSAPSHQPQQSTLPEGKRYAYFKSQAGIPIVTEANIAEPGVSDQLNAWLTLICNVVTEKHVNFPETSHLFLEIHQDLGTCSYYFVDHGFRTVFWLHTLNTINVGLPPSSSDVCPQYYLEANYWIHVELFPETASQYSAKALNELQVIFSKASTSADAPAFPYTAIECEDFLDFLESSKDHASSPYVITRVARLLANVANHRFLTHFGEGHCRLSSKQPMLKFPDSKCGCTLAMLSKMFLFGFPDRYEARFESFWADQLVDALRWREHASETVEDLKQTMSFILALLGASSLTSSSSSLVKASLFLCTFDLAVTSFLLQRQQRLLSTDIPTSVAYLKHWNTSYGFQPIAIVHSLPQALFVWALLLFSMQGFWMDFSDLPLTSLLCTLLPVAVILVVVGVGIWLIVRPRPEPADDAMSVEQKERPTAESMV